MTHRILKSKIDTAFGGVDRFGASVGAYCAELKAWRRQNEIVKQEALEPLSPRPMPTEYDDVSAYTRAVTDWNSKQAARHSPYPHPTAGVEILAAVNADGEPDFEVIDDTPPPPSASDLLPLRKAILSRDIAAQEAAALAMILPEMKIRYFQMREEDIRSNDRSRARDLENRRSRLKQDIDRLATIVKQADVDYIASFNRSVADEGDAGVLRQRYAEFNAMSVNDRIAENHEAVVAASEINKLVADIGEVEAEMSNLDGHHVHHRPKADTDFLLDLQKRRDEVRRVSMWSARMQHDIDDLTVDTIETWAPEPMPL